MIKFFDEVDDDNRVYRMMVDATSHARQIAAEGGRPVVACHDVFSEGMIGFAITDASQSIGDQEIGQFRISLHSLWNDMQGADQEPYGEWDPDTLAPLRKALGDKAGRVSIARAINRLAMTEQEPVHVAGIARMVKRVYNVDEDLRHLLPDEG